MFHSVTEANDYYIVETMGSIDRSFEIRRNVIYYQKSSWFRWFHEELCLHSVKLYFSSGQKCDRLMSRSVRIKRNETANLEFRPWLIKIQL